GLYFAIQMKKADASHDVTVIERNPLDATFGFGVVFSDATQDNLAEADRETYKEMARRFRHWDDIDVHFNGTVITSTGHGFSGLSRRALLAIMSRRAKAVGVCVEVGTEVADVRPYLGADLVLAADGFNSVVRQQFADRFNPTVDWRPNRYVWLGTNRPFPAFTFYFKRDRHGLCRVHAYQYERGCSTFIVEATEATWQAAGMDRADEDATLAFCEALFKEELQGHRLLKNRSLWRTFTTIKNAKWSHNNVVLVGDAAHTAHFSVGSGTKLAIEDAISLAGALRRHSDVHTAPPEDEKQSAVPRTAHGARPPMFTPLKLRDLVLTNRVVVSPMCQYVGEDGMPNEWHLVHLGSRAVGGAGLLFTEMTDVSREGRI